MADSYLVSASEQTAITNWVTRHRTTLITVGAGLVAVYLFTDIPITVANVAFIAFLLWLARSWAGAAWWVRKRRRTLAKASLPAPRLMQMLRDRRTEKRRAKRILKQWPAFCEAYNFVGGGKLKLVPRLWKMTASVELDVTAMVSPGPIAVKGGVDRLVGLSWELKEVIGEDCKEVLIRRVGTEHASVTFLWTEALERVLPVADMPAATKDNEVAYGIRRSGKAATVRMCDHVLVGGMTGSGKSGWAWALLADLNRKNLPYQCYVGNLKGAPSSAPTATRWDSGTAPPASSATRRTSNRPASSSTGSTTTCWPAPRSSSPASGCRSTPTSTRWRSCGWTRWSR